MLEIISHILIISVASDNKNYPSKFLSGCWPHCYHWLSHGKAFFATLHVEYSFYSSFSHFFGLSFDSCSEHIDVWMLRISPSVDFSEIISGMHTCRKEKAFSCHFDRHCLLWFEKSLVQFSDLFIGTLFFRCLFRFDWHSNCCFAYASNSITKWFLIPFVHFILWRRCWANTETSKKKKKN